jgi:predicted lipoprotein with Yx(FWY)xxD motif
MIGAAVVTLACAALIAGCGDDDEAPSAARTPTATATATVVEARATQDAKPAPKRGRTVKLISSQFGKILGDGRGQAFYYFDKEQTRRSECYGACARAWPPVLTEGRTVAGKGARARLIGTTKRRNGKRQVTYDGRPLYYYVDDGPGRVLCHNVSEFGGLWLVIERDGEPVP